MFSFASPRPTLQKTFKDSLFQLVRLAFGALFIYASYYKILSPGAFAHQIYNYKILPPWAINPIALTLPWLQLFSGVALILNRGARAASFIISSMLFVFQVAMVSALVRKLNISCGCFKSGGSPATWWTFARDFSLFFFSLVLAWNTFQKKKAEGSSCT
jgi:uncharacterized membrane protein YphA (DoxX/SURF4 family)